MASYVMEGLECTKLTAGNSAVGSLWVGNKGQIMWMSLWEFATHLPARMMKLMDYALRNKRITLNQLPLFLWETSVYFPDLTESTKQMAQTGPEDSQNTWMTTS